MANSPTAEDASTKDDPSPSATPRIAPQVVIVPVPERSTIDADGPRDPRWAYREVSFSVIQLARWPPARIVVLAVVVTLASYSLYRVMSQRTANVGTEPDKPSASTVPGRAPAAALTLDGRSAPPWSRSPLRQEKTAARRLGRARLQRTEGQFLERSRCSGPTPGIYRTNRCSASSK